MQVKCEVVQQSRLLQNKAMLVLKDHRDQQFRKVGHAFSAHMCEFLGHHNSFYSGLIIRIV